MYERLIPMMGQNVVSGPTVFQDDFASSIDSSKWWTTAVRPNGGSASVVSGKLRLTCEGSSTGVYAERRLQSVPNLDFTGHFVSFDIDPVTNMAGSSVEGGVLLVDLNDPTNSILMTDAGGTLVMRITNAGASTQSSMTYPTCSAFKIEHRNSDNKWLFYTFNGGSWTLQWTSSVAATWNPTNTRIQLYVAQYFVGAGSTTYTEFDNVLTDIYGTDLPFPVGLPVWAYYEAESMTGQAPNTFGTAWDDLSGNARHPTAVNLYKVTDQLNHKVAFELNHGGTTGYADLPSMASLTEGECFVIGKADNDPGSGSNQGMHAMGNFSTDVVLPWTDGNVYDGWGSNSRKSAGSSGGKLGNWFVYNVRSTASNWVTKINFAAHFSNGSNTVSFSANPTIGSSKQSHAGVAYDGRLAGYYIFSPVLSGPELAALRLYLNWFYGMSN